MAQQFYQPQRRRRSEDDDFNAPLVPTSPLEPASRASESAQHTLDNIDQTLAENDQALHNNQAESPQSLRSQEETAANEGETSAASTAAGGVAAGLAAAENDPNSEGFYNALDGAADGKSGGRFRLSISRRKGIAGGLVGLLLGGGVFFGLGIASGPLQVIHLGQVLEHSFSKNNEDSANRLHHLFRYAKASKTGNIGETRVGILGSKVFGSTVEQLKEIGVSIETNGTTGAPTRTTINTDKLKTNFPELEGMDDTSKRAFIADKLGVPLEAVEGGGHNFQIDQKNFDMKAAEFSTKSSVKLLNDGKIVTGIKARVMTKYFNLPSLFHPLKRALASKSNEATNSKLRLQEEQQAEEKRKAALTEPTEARATGAVEDVKSGKGIKGGVVKALNFTAGACFARKVAGDIVTIDRYRVVLPAAIEATNMIALGSQVMAGKDLTGDQLGAVISGFTDKDGKDIWGGKALQELAGGSAAGLLDISPDQKQAFASNETASKIRSWADAALAGTVLPPGFTCSSVVQWSLTLGQVALTIIGEVASAGTLTPAFAAEFAVNTAASVTVTAVAMHFLERFVLNETTAKELAKYAFSGPAGGDLLAYGSRAAADLTGIASGGIDLGNKASTFLAANDQQQFESESMFARMFDANDYRSLMGRIVDSISPSVSQNIASLAGNFTRIGSLIPGVFASLLPKASADTQPYNWGFSQYGLPESMLENPQLQDPYANGAAVATMLDKGDKKASDYISKAKTCFGVDIIKSSGAWDVIPQKDVDPNSGDYVDAHCNDTSQLDWQRVIMFVFDTNTMKAAACYEGDDQSCADEGMGGGTSTSTSAGDIDTSALYQSSVDVPCASGTTDLGNATGYANGSPVQIHLCGIPDLPSSSEESNSSSPYYVQGANGEAIVNARVSSAFLSLVKAAKTAGIPMHANSSFRTMAHQQALCNQNSACSSGSYTYVAKPGTSNHQMGLAIDFTMANTSSFPDSSGSCVSVSGRCEAPGDQVWEWLNTNASSYGIKPYVNEYWHWSPTGN